MVESSNKRAFIFDAYGTLFDVHAAVGRHAPRIGPDADRLSQIWRAKQLEYSWVLGLSGRYEPFWRLTERALDHALASCPAVDPTLRVDLLDAYRVLDCYPEVPDVLRRLRDEGARTGILSNGDHHMLGAAVRSAGIEDLLDRVLSVDTVRCFKTDPRVYAMATEAFETLHDNIVFVSSNRWDIAGATAFGFSCIWVNRNGLPDEYLDLAPQRQVDDLTGLLAQT
jgi:2-haloacid dehalogenase